MELAVPPHFSRRVQFPACREAGARPKRWFKDKNFRVGNSTAINK